MVLILFICGDVELNPGPENMIFHARDFFKLSLIETFNTRHNFDMICLSETYFNSSYADDDPRLTLKDFTLIWADNSHNCKQGGASI